ncbi:hypothetical protein HPG69_004543 [Diceros bicornis minor]|uniref:Uncharacterized protein n=1 Tax=Diceros bicornis minor TaxID=77932 RepID=A0A7J7F9J0_DICBM|nr:hypothetical protein HPG69_004543 [Diceros bicornis minor]
MSGRQVSSSNTYSCLNHPNNVSFPARNPGWSHCPSVTRANGLKRPRTPSGSEASSCSNPSEQSDSPGFPRLPVRRICMGRPYHSKCVETSHLVNCRKVARKPACRGSPYYLPCTDHPAGPSGPTFLDHLIKGINYLDRSTNAFCTNCPKSSLSLPRLAANYLQHAANSIHLDPPDHSFPCSYSHSSASVATSDKACPSTCLVPSARDVHALQCVDDSANTSCTRRLPSRNLTPMLPQRRGIKLPELPLLGNGIFSLGRLPKFWEAIRSGWSAPEPISKPCSWW